MTNENHQNQSEVVLFHQMMIMNGAARVYHKAVEMNLFDALIDGGCAVEALAEKCQLNKVALEKMLPVLEALGLVMPQAGEILVLTELGRQLTAGAYRRLGDLYWDYLPIFLKKNEPLHKMDDADHSESHYVKQAVALAWMMQPSVQVFAKQIGKDNASRKIRILDVGAGSGIWSLSLAQMMTQATVDLLDWPQVLTVAGNFSKKLGVADRVSFLPGNYRELELSRNTYDWIILANVVHLETPSGLMALFAKCRSCLKAGGELLVVDVFDGQPRGDLARTLYSLGLALRTQAGRVYTVEEMKKILQQSNFQATGYEPIEASPFTHSVLRAQINVCEPEA